MLQNVQDGHINYTLNQELLMMFCAYNTTA